ncbi:MAG: hypothetical protein AAFV45_11880 [Pseudomonadota bacterium]
MRATGINLTATDARRPARPRNASAQASIGATIAAPVSLCGLALVLLMPDTAGSLAIVLKWTGVWSDGFWSAQTWPGGAGLQAPLVGAGMPTIWGFDSFKAATATDQTAVMVATALILPMAVTYWAAHQSSALGPMTVFILCVIFDLLAGSTIGGTALTALMGYATALVVVNASPDTKRTPTLPTIWGLATLTACFGGLLLWGVDMFSAPTGGALDVRAIASGAALATLVFPFVAIWLWLNRMLANMSRS